MTATPVIHSGRYHFHFDADALFLGFCRLLRSFQFFDATASPYICLLRLVMETAMFAQEWLGIAASLSFDSSIETNWDSAGPSIEQFSRRDACSVLNMVKLCGLLEGDRRRRSFFCLLVFSCPAFGFTLLFASRWLCLYKPGPLKKRGLRANDVATRALKDMRPTLLLFLQKLECVQAEWTACVFYITFV